MIGSFDVRVSRSSMTAAGSSPWTYPETLMSIPAHRSPGDGMVENARVRLPVAPGQALCASARARDAAGNVGDWSPMSCAVRFLDDGSLRRHGPVRRLHDHHYSGGRATALRGRGELVLRGAQPNSIVAVLTSEEPRRSRRSYVVVRVPGHRREVDACLVGRADVRTRRYSVASACRATARWGPIRLRSSEGSLSAAVDGVALLPRWTWPAWLEPPLP
jgi:hypothetical protein